MIRRQARDKYAEPEIHAGQALLGTESVPAGPAETRRRAVAAVPAEAVCMGTDFGQNRERKPGWPNALAMVTRVMQSLRCRLVGSLVLVVAAYGHVYAQSVPVIDVDHATFAYDAEHAAIEVYLAFQAESLEYADEEGQFVARLPLSFSLARASDGTISEVSAPVAWEDEQTVEFVVADTAGIVEGQYYLRQARLTSPPGEFELVVVAADSAGVPVAEIRRDVIVPDFLDASSAKVSDITISTGIVQSSNREDPFYKNGLSITPNPNHLYGEGVSRLFYYVEVYHADQVATAAGQYTALVYVAAANSAAPLAGLQKRLVRPARMPDVLVGTFDLQALPTGTYFVHVVLLDEGNAAVGEQTQKFFVYNPAVAVEAPEPLEVSFETSEYASMPEEEVDEAFQYIRIIATEQEERRIRRIEDLDEKRRFLMTFWEVRDPTPSTAENEVQEEFYSLLSYANERYSVRTVAGWETDRGRTLIKYGAPSDIEPHLYERDVKPYEIWTYNNIPGEGQGLFVFADLDGFGEFEMIHSTVAGERRLPNWQRELRGSF